MPKQVHVPCSHLHSSYLHRSISSIMSWILAATALAFAGRATATAGDVGYTFGGRHLLDTTEPGVLLFILMPLACWCPMHAEATCIPKPCTY